MSRTPHGMLPDFIGIGPGRTGSTWLHNVLNGHVGLPLNIKETNFFFHYYDRGIGWYAAHFRHCDEARPVAEICPYLSAPRAPELIAQYMPDCKVIVTLRDPIDRLYSHYKMMRANVFTRGSLDEAVRSDAPMVEGSRYATHLKRWWDRLGREKMLVTWYDDLRARPQKYIDDVTGFMGIERIDLSGRNERSEVINSFDRAPKSERLARKARRMRVRLVRNGWYRTVNHLNRAGVWRWCAGRGEPYPRITFEQETALRKLFLPEVEALEEMLGCDLSRWKTARGSDDAASAVASRFRARAASR